MTACVSFLSPTAMMSEQQIIQKIEAGGGIPFQYIQVKNFIKQFWRQFVLDLLQHLSLLLSLSQHTNTWCPNSMASCYQRYKQKIRLNVLGN